MPGSEDGSHQRGRELTLLLTLWALQGGLQMVSSFQQYGRRLAWGQGDRERQCVSVDTGMAVVYSKRQDELQEKLKQQQRGLNSQ